MGRRPPAKKPSFMKILVEDLPKKLIIPPKFVRLHHGTLAKKCILRPTGTQGSWPVRTKQINNSLYFTKGWKKFAQHHSLGFGDLLIFRYAQDCEFYVDMFDKSCCNKEPVTSQNVGSQKETTPILPGQEKKSDLDTLAIDAAEEFVASSEFPTFNRIVKSAYMTFGGYMPIDPDFAKKFLKDGTRAVKIEVSGKTWIVGLAGGFSCRLGRGWGYLAKEYALEAGDICVFQLVDTEDFTLELSIFSSTRYGKTPETHFIQAVEGHSSQALEAQSGLTLETHSSQALKSANEFLSLSKYPSYSCILHFSYVRKSYMYVPSTFVKEMNGKSGSIKVKLECRGKEWDAVISTYGYNAKINNGWSIFARENSLQIGDVCVFELINKKDALIRVTNFECTD